MAMTYGEILRAYRLALEEFDKSPSPEKSEDAKRLARLLADRNLQARAANPETFVGPDPNEWYKEVVSDIDVKLGWSRRK